MKHLLVLLLAFPFSAFCSDTFPSDSDAVVLILNRDFPESELLFFEKADLNLDGLEDFAIVATRTCDDNESGIGDENNPVTCRKFILAINTGDNYKIAASSDSFIDCSLCGGGWSLHDALLNFAVGEGWFEVTQHYGACERDIICDRYTYDKSRDHWYRTVHRIELTDCKNEEDPSKTELYQEMITPIEEAMLGFGE